VIRNTAYVFAPRGASGLLCWHDSGPSRHAEASASIRIAMGSSLFAHKTMITCRGINGSSKAMLFLFYLWQRARVINSTGMLRSKHQRAGMRNYGRAASTSMPRVTIVMGAGGPKARPWDDDDPARSLVGCRSAAYVYANAEEGAWADQEAEAVWFPTKIRLPRVFESSRGQRVTFFRTREKNFGCPSSTPGRVANWYG